MLYIPRFTFLVAYFIFYDPCDSTFHIPHSKYFMFYVLRSLFYISYPIVSTHILYPEFL